MRKLSGWWRLWILSMLAWTASVAGYCYLYWPPHAQAKHTPTFIDQLARSQQAQLLDKGETSDGFQVLMPNGFTLRFKSGVGEEAATKVARSYHEISVRAQEEANRSRAIRFLIVAFLPSLAVALLGIGIAWVRRGFRQ